MTPKANDIYLTVISDRSDYRRRCHVALTFRADLAATFWVRRAARADWQAAAKFGSDPATLVELLEAAAGLAQYYEEHLAEMDAETRESYREPEPLPTVPDRLAAEARRDLNNALAQGRVMGALIDTIFRRKE